MVTESAKRNSYTHIDTGSTVPFGIAGYYMPLEEVRLPYNGKEVLYVTGKVVMEAPCCKMAPDWVYVVVPGYILEWQHETNENGEKVTRVEPVGSTDKETVTKLIQEKEGYLPVDFW